MNLRLVVSSIAALVATSSLMLACSGDDDSGISSDPCPIDGMQPCDDDIAVTQAQHDTCETTSASPCGTPFKAYQLCLNENTKCTAAKMTDTAAQASACAPQLAAYQTCAAPDSST